MPYKDKEKEKAHKKEYREKNREKIRERRRKWWKKYFAENHPHLLEMQRKRYKPHPRQPKPEGELSQERAAICMRALRKKRKMPNGNVTRTKKMACVHNKIEVRKPLMQPLCELCPEDDKRKPTQRHHPDYDYPLIFVSLCDSCHKSLHIWLKKQPLEALSIG